VEETPAMDGQASITRARLLLVVSQQRSHQSTKWCKMLLYLVPPMQILDQLEMMGFQISKDLIRRN